MMSSAVQYLLLLGSALFFAQTAHAAVSYSQSVTLQPGWNIVSTPRILESHTFSAPETLSNFSIFLLDPTAPSGWATMAELGQTEFAPLYGYFIFNNTGSTESLAFHYKASTTPNQRLFDREFTAEGWYSFGIANPTYATEQGESVSDTNNPDLTLSSVMSYISNYAAVVDFTDGASLLNPDSVSANEDWVYAMRSPDTADNTEINLLNDFRETKGYAIYVNNPTTTLLGFQNNNSPACSDGVDNDIDGLTDYPVDDACNSPTDSDESPAFVTGALTMTKSAASLSGNVSVGSTGVALAKFNIQGSGEKLKIENLTVSFSSSNAALGSIRNGALFLSGVQVGSTANILSATGTQFNLGSSMVLDVGTTYTLEVRGDAFDADGINDVSIGDTLQVQIKAGTSNVLRVTSSDYISSPNVNGNSLTVSGGTLSLAKYTAYAAQTVTVPQTAYKLADFRLTGSTEAINLNTLTLTFAGSLVATSTDLSNIYVVYGTKTSQIKSTGGDQTWSVNETLAANTTMNVAVYGTLGAGMTTGIFLTPSLKMDGTSQASGNAVGSGTVAGQTITAGAGSITSALDASTPVSANVVANSMPKVASFKFTGTNDAFTITELTSKLTGTVSAAAVSEVIFKDGATTVATQAVVLNGGVYTATTSGLTILVPYNSTKIIDAYVNLGGIGTGYSTTSVNVAVTLDGFEYQNSNGVKDRSYTDRVGNDFYAYKTKPVITNVALPTSILAAGTMTVAKFTITADAGGTVSWQKIRLSVASTTGVTASGWAIYDSANESTALANIGAASTSIPLGQVEFVSSADQEVSGSKTYVVKALLGGTITSGASFGVSIPSGGAGYVRSANHVVAPSASFVWSDESVLGHSMNSNDWFNDYMVKNLPTDSQTMSK